MSALWIGLDVGTTTVKAAAYAPGGACIAESAVPSEVKQGSGGESEQDMAGVRACVMHALAGLGGKIDVASVASLGIAAQGDGFWAVDADGEPVAPAMLWNDTRAAADLDALADSGATAAIGRGCHTALWAGTSGMLWRWLRARDGDAAGRVARVMTCADWVGHSLTGEWATDWSNASIPFLDFATRSYGQAQLEALDCRDLEDKLNPPRRAATQLGGLTADAAKATGLPEGIPVSVGTLDLSAMIVGMCMDRPGQTMMIMGTTAVVNILSDSLAPEGGPVGAAVLHPTAEIAIKVLAPTSGASAIDWFTRLHPRMLGGRSAGEVAERLNALVADVPPGANGVTFLPYLSGERAPFVASDIRAGFHGLSAATSNAEMGRAVMEGAAFSLRHCFVSQGGLPAEPVQLSGGGSRNAIWCQIIADVMQQDVIVSDASDQGLWGAACIGAGAAGLGDPVMLAKRVEDHVMYRPDPTNGPLYDRAFARYRVLSDAARAVRAKLGSLKGPDG